MKHKILIVDDEEPTRDGLRSILEFKNKDLDIYIAADGNEALKIIENTDIDLIISDLRMPGMDGMTLLSLVKEGYPDIDVIIMTAFGQIDTAIEAMKKGAVDYLQKPVQIEEISLLVNRILEQRAIKEENIRLKEEIGQKYSFEKIIGISEPMQKIFKKIQLVAPTKSTVLICGESGTGKELIASAIHYNSSRRHKPFIKVNCGALTPTLLESELFGHEKGAFTNAFKQKEGRFELADGGTILLDEISETSLDFQVKLLRVLQEQEFERVGGTQTIKVDVRVICTTNKDLEQYVAEKKFREDLFYRLNVIQIKVPPLRDRQEDILLLIDNFMTEFCHENNKEKLSLSSKVISLLQNYHWPGNVRQLRNIIEGIVVMSSTKVITPKNLPEDIRLEGDKEEYIKLRSGSTLKDAEKELIKITLSECNGNKALAARKLGLGRKTLYRKIEEYGIKENINDE